MKKIFTLLAALLLIGASANAKQLECNLSALPATSENTTWDAENNIFAWSTTYYNSTEIFGGDDYSAYTTLNLDTETDTYENFRIIIKFSNGADQATFVTSTGKQSLTWADMGVAKDNVKAISTIRLSGHNGGTGSIKVNSISLEGPDTKVYEPIKLYPSNATELSKLTGTNTNWASTVIYPKEFKTQGLAFGDGDGSAEATHVTISDYESITFVVSKVAGGDGNNSLRVWIWNGSGVVTLFPYPADQYETADFTVPYEISEPGIYKVKVEGYDYLKGVKAENDWSYPSIYVDYAYATPIGGKDLAIDEALTFSSSEILDFTEVTDIKAYIATGTTESTVTLKQVTGAVPANTGLVLVPATEKSVYSIPTCGEATVDVTGNILVATTEETTVSENNYVLAGTGDMLGWYIVAGDRPTLSAGKAYLTAATSGAKLNIVFEDDATAITAPAASAVKDNAYYTLQGVRVNNPVKGIYINNGKKVFINK